MGSEGVAETGVGILVASTLLQTVVHVLTVGFSPKEDSPTLTARLIPRQQLSS